MTFATMQLIPLKSAYLCQDCNCVCNSAEQCPACASGVLMGLARILDRKPELTSQLSFARMQGMGT
jgi:hypothetical protein